MARSLLRSNATVPGTHNSISVPRAALLRMRESRADSFGPLAHPLQAPVSIPIQGTRVDSTPVVANGDAQFSAPIVDLRFDALGLGMPVRIKNRFPANAVYFVARPCLQLSRPAFYNHSKSHR